MISASATLRLNVVGPALGLAQQGGGTFLGLDHDFGRLVVGVPEDLRAVLPEGGGEGRLVDHGMRRPFVGRRHGLPQLLFPLLEHLDAAGHRLEIGLHLIDVEPPPHDREGVPGDVTRGDPGRGNG
jgi:hypothetical protein